MKDNQPRVYGIHFDTPATSPNPWINRIAYLSIFIFVISASYVLFSGRDHYRGGGLVGGPPPGSGCNIAIYLGGTNYFWMLLEGRSEEVYIDFFDLYSSKSDQNLDEAEFKEVTFN